MLNNCCSQSQDHEGPGAPDTCPTNKLSNSVRRQGARRQLRSESTSDGGTTNTSAINRGPCVRRCRSTSVEQFTASLPLHLQIVVFLRERT